jgi:hypothetical protein
MPITLEDHIPKVGTRYGAPMGRRTDGTYDPEVCASFAGKVSLRCICRGAYDAGGAYWGLGDPVYSALSDNGIVDMTLRARNRAAAKAEVRAIYPNCKFYN